MKDRLKGMLYDFIFYFIVNFALSKCIVFYIYVLD